MSAFEFFFSFYGLVLSLSVAVIATGLATAIQHRRKISIGWLTPTLAIFVALDIATFWDSAWTNLRDLPFSYGLLVAGLSVALVYFIAATLVFPHQIEDGVSLNDHFWANKRIVLWLLTAANVLGLLLTLWASIGREDVLATMLGYTPGAVIYAALIIPAALAKKARLIFWCLGIHIVIYLLLGVASAVSTTLGAPPSPPETIAPR